MKHLLTFPMPESGIIGSQLETELANAGLTAGVSVTVDGDVFVGVESEVDEAAVRTSVETVLAAHTPEPVEPPVVVEPLTPEEILALRSLLV